jgi:S-adenosylmethionine:tRNA ribosyltransferase-isomerase
MLPPELEAHEPPEARGIARDEVRLLITRGADGRAEHRSFLDLADLVEPGDVLVVNQSATLPAALDVTRVDGTPLRLHASTRSSATRWVVEVRRPGEPASTPYREGRRGEVLFLPEGATMRLLRPFRPSGAPRLWEADLIGAAALEPILHAHGRPIRYGYVPRDWPLASYQTVFATEPGSAEMPSAGRPFTERTLSALAARGVAVHPITLHTGVASLEDDERPYPERYRVSEATASAVTRARGEGRRIVAVGTTVVRALESATSIDGETRAQEGWTDLVISPALGVRAVDGLLTGFHEPRSTHLWMLEAIAGRDHVDAAYAAALQAGYLWHEFGDSHLILP